MVPGEEAHGAEVPGEEEAIEASPPEVSPEVEGEAFRVRECEAEVPDLGFVAEMNDQFAAGLWR